MRHRVYAGRQVHSWRPFVLALVVALLAACRGPGVATEHAPTASREVLTRDEILASTASQGDLLQAIMSLRPTFLANPRISTRGSSSSSPLVIYVDHIQQPGLEVLRTISATKVAEVRYLEPMASQSEFGSKAAGGALVIRLYRPTDADRPPAAR